MTQLLRSRPSSAIRLLDRVLENPGLIAAVRELEGPVLGKLIHSVGLEDAAELVALASTEQLETVFDEDLWRLDPGQWEERFDGARFALWLHAFAEAGEEALVRRLIELPRDFVILAVHRLVLVLDIESLAVEMSSSGGDHDLVEKALDGCLCEEWEEFRLIARDDSAWEDLSSALLALDRDHHPILRQILERCADMSSEWIEDNGGLYRVLSSDAMLENDQRAEREDRRAEKGYVSPADARAFLELARRGDTDPSRRDAITNAYFRGLGRAGTRPAQAKGPKARSKREDALMQLLEAAAVIEPAPTASPSPRPEQSTAQRRRRRSMPPPSNQRDATQKDGALVQVKSRALDVALAQLKQIEPERYAARMDEVGYLANVLLAARQQGLRPIEAVERALTIANRGLERLIEGGSDGATELLRETTVDSLFRLGFRA